MGYACPVCDTPQRDGEHLANHLAFTAMLRSDEHEAWLDEHAPGWGEQRPADLADRVTAFAEEAEYDEVFEDTVGGGHDHDHSPGAGRGPAAGGAAGAEGASGFESMAGSVADDAVESVISEAQELTEEMYGLDETEGTDERGASGTDEDGADDGTDEGTADGDGSADDSARDGERGDADDAGA